MVSQGRTVKDVVDLDQSVAMSRHVLRKKEMLSRRSEQRRADAATYTKHPGIESLSRFVFMVCGFAGLNEREHWRIRAVDALPNRKKDIHASRRTKVPDGRLSRKAFPHFDDLDTDQAPHLDERYSIARYETANDPAPFRNVRDISKSDHKFLAKKLCYLSPLVAASLQKALHNLRHLPEGNLRTVPLKRLLRSQSPAVQLAEWTALLIITSMSATSAIWTRVQSMQQVVTRLRAVELYFRSVEDDVEAERADDFFDSDDSDGGKRSARSSSARALPPRADVKSSANKYPSVLPVGRTPTNSPRPNTRRKLATEMGK